MLYFQYRDSRSIIDKKILYFNEYLRTRFYLSEVKVNDELIAKISAKSLMNIDDVKNLFNVLNVMKEKIVVDDNDVIKLSRAIEEFKARVQ